MGAQQVEPKSPPRKARLRNSWKLFVKTCFYRTTTIQRHFPKQQLNQVRRTIVTEQWTLHCWDVRPNISCSSRWSKKIKNQISIAPVRRMSFLADSVLAYLAIHVTFRARASLDHSWSVCIFSVLFSVQLLNALTKRVRLSNRKIFIFWQSFSILVTFMSDSGVIL